MRIAALVLLGIGVALSLLNWASLVASWRKQRRGSPVFPPPSVLTALGLALLPETRAYWWVGLLTDYSFLALLIAAPSLSAQAWRRSSFTRIQLLHAQDAARRFELSLHRGGHFVLRATFEPPMPCDARGSRVASFGAVGQWQEAVAGRLRLWGYGEERVLTLERCDAGFISHEEHYPQGREYPYDSLTGLKFRPVA